MTNVEIDKLSGRELDRSVALENGWSYDEYAYQWYGPDATRVETFPDYSTDIGLAFGLLLESGAIFNVVSGFAFSVRTCQGDEWIELASGQKPDAAAIFCRAFLNLKAGQ